MGVFRGTNKNSSGGRMMPGKQKHFMGEVHGENCMTQNSQEVFT